MIKLSKKDFSAPPEKLLSDPCIEQIRIAIKERDGARYTSTYYKSSEVL